MRKKTPKELAIINADNCTGCEACLEVCPVDCIIKKSETTGSFKSWCEIDLDTCVGCQLCVRIPGKKTNPYELKVCPWDAIEMTPIDKIVDTVAKIGGPPDYVENNFDRLVETAIKISQNT